MSSRFRLLTVALVATGAVLISAPGGVSATPPAVVTPASGDVVAEVGTVVAAKRCAKTYTAVRNDSWSRIAGKVKVSLKDLLAANDAKTSTMILIGDVLCLPKSAVTKEDVRGLKIGAPAKRYTRGQSAAIIREIWPNRLEERALAIAKRESKLNAANVSWCCVGLFQLHWSAHKSWLARMGITAPEQLLDARTNAEAALELYRRNSGWGPWE